MDRSRLIRGLAVALVLALAGCASTAEQDGAPLAREVAFEGDPEADVDDLRELVAPWIADYVATGGAAAYLDDAAYELQLRYRDAGHPFVEVAYRISEEDGVTFELEPGPLIVLERLEIVGAHWMDPEEVEDLFAFPRRRVDDSRTEVFTERALREGVESLDGRFFEGGFLDVSIAPPEVTIDRAAGRAQVRVVVDQGERYRVARIELIGPIELEPSTVEAVVAPYRDRPYDPRLPYELRNDLLELYGNSGRPDARIEFERRIDADAATVDLDVVIEAGVEVWISEVRVVGNRDTTEAFVLDRVIVGKGERYSREKARKSFERLYRTGLFDRVAVQLAAGGEAQRTLLVELEERPSQEVFVEPGYGAYELFRLKAGYRELNLFGTGRQLRLEGVIGVRAQSAEIGVSDPDFFDQDLFADLSQGYDRREFPSFTRTEYSTVFSLRWPWTTHLEGFVSYQYRDSSLSDNDVVDAELLASEQDIDISSISFSPRYDTRDRLFVPKGGLVSNLNVEWASSAFGSEIDFTRTTVKAARYFTLDDEGDSILALGGELGVIYPLGDTDTIPLQERYFNGGAKTIRAFKQYELGPVDANGEQIGGEGYSVATIELRQRLYGRLQGALFADYGSVVLDGDDLLKFDELEGGVGIGLRYVLPVGPLRIDFAVNTDPEDGQDESVLHIAVGMPF